MSVFSGSWDVFEDALSHPLYSFQKKCAFFWRAKPKTRIAFKLGSYCYQEEWNNYYESSMMALPGSIRCSCQEESKDGAPSDRMNNHLLLWLRKSYDISMHTSTRWGGCQFSKNVWKVEQKLLLKQYESLLFKMNHPLSLRMLWDTSQSGHKYSSPIRDISLSS